MSTMIEKLGRDAVRNHLAPSRWCYHCGSVYRPCAVEPHDGYCRDECRGKLDTDLMYQKRLGDERRKLLV